MHQFFLYIINSGVVWAPVGQLCRGSRHTQRTSQRPAAAERPSGWSIIAPAPHLLTCFVTVNSLQLHLRIDLIKKTLARIRKYMFPLLPVLMNWMKWTRKVVETCSLTCPTPKSQNFQNGSVVFIKSQIEITTHFDRLYRIGQLGQFCWDRKSSFNKLLIKNVAEAQQEA